MSGKRYTEEFKIGTVGQVNEKGYSIDEVADRLGTTTQLGSRKNYNVSLKSETF